MSKKYEKYSKKIERNILNVYSKANFEDIFRGLEWYSSVKHFSKQLGEKFQVELDKVVGVIAALSPGREWGLNLLDAQVLIEAWKDKDPIPTVGSYGRRNVEKALKILNGQKPLDILGGNKVRSFYSNILNEDSNEVTIDRHAKCCAYNTDVFNEKSPRNKEYFWLAKHFKKIANEIGLKAYQLQAICWVTWKRLKEEETKRRGGTFLMNYSTWSLEECNKSLETLYSYREHPLGLSEQGKQLIEQRIEYIERLKEDLNG